MGGKTPKFSVVFLTVALVLGIVVGYGVNDVITSPKIGSLREEIENKNNQIISLQTTIDLLEENITSLMVSLTDLTELYDNLAENTVPKSQYDALATEHQELTVDYIALEEDYIALEEDYIALEVRSSSLESIIEELTEENQELLDEYEELLVKYTEIRVLSWTYFEAHSLSVNLTTTTTTYDKNKPIIGSISIYHEDNQPFNGTIKLILWSNYYSSGIKSDKFSVYGKTNYSFSYPFIQGPGIYYLRVSEIIDAEGDTVVTYYEAKEYSIKITMG